MRPNSVLSKASILIILIITLIHIYSSRIYSQGSFGPTFKQIEYLTYDLNSPRTKIKDQIEVENYVKIDGKGKMYIIESNKGLNYFSYQLSKEEINLLNQVFNGEKNLKKFVINRKQDKGVFYAGYYEFLKYVDMNNHSDQISFIDGDLLDNLNDILSMINLRSSSFKNDELLKEKEFDIDSLFINEVFENHLKNKRLPNIELPPPPGIN